MDPSSVITQASPDHDASHYFVAPKEKKKRSNFLCSIICCLGKRSSKFKDKKDGGANGGAGAAGTVGGTAGDLHGDHLKANHGQTTGKGAKPLLPEIRPEDVDKKCIVIDLDETLVHSSFKPISNADFIVPVEIDNVIHQVYVLKRPYVDEFLCRMGELFECVLFTASLAKYADPVADLLDKWDVFQSRLFRESCVFHKGNYVKDLGKLGRELQKIIIVDNSPASYIFHPENAVPVASWFDDMHDRELLDLIPFFENVSKVDSVYQILSDATTLGGKAVTATPVQLSTTVSSPGGAITSVEPPSQQQQQAQSSSTSPSGSSLVNKKNNHNNSSSAAAAAALQQQSVPS